MSEKEVLCPACGAAMERKLQNFTIGLDGGGGLLSGLWHEQYDVDLYACPQCGKVELYTANFQKKEEKPEEEAEGPRPLEDSDAPEEPGPKSGGLFGFGAKSREKRPPWEKQ